VLSPSRTKIEAQDVRYSACRLLDLSVLEQDDLCLLALKVTPDDARDQETFQNAKPKMHWSFMYMHGEGESSERLESLP